MKVLIVEDDLVIGKMLAEELKKWQLEPILIEGFNHVMDAFNTNAPELVSGDS
ncbi:hypothetical protein T807_02869 [Staphylococcus aureus GGMC6004]|nr:hypothetical protein T807_02869 [Staphylococcus aureus GGMC6004]